MVMAIPLIRQLDTACRRCENSAPWNGFGSSGICVERHGKAPRRGMTSTIQGLLSDRRFREDPEFVGVADASNQHLFSLGCFGEPKGWARCWTNVGLRAQSFAKSSFRPNHLASNLKRSRLSFLAHFSRGHPSS